MRRSLFRGLIVFGALATCAGCAWWFVSPVPVNTPKVVSGRLADNSVCLVCHMDFEEEPLSAKHVKVGLGCSSCHGDSAAHGDDELNITKPDVLFGRTEIEMYCRSCHPTHVTGAKYDAFLKKWKGKRRPNGRMVMNDSVCTDCHGNHAILRPDQLEHVPADEG